MKRHAKSLIILVAGSLLVFGLPVQTVQAGVVESGVAQLADAFGTATGPESLTVNYSVTVDSGGVYTYSYIVNNPSGDVLLNDDGSPTTTPETFDAFSVGFNTTIPGAFLSGNQTQNNGASGLYWFFDPVNAGASSATLSFTSDDAPTMGNANASDNNLPSPWRSTPLGEKVPVPQTIVPDSTSTLALLAGVLLLLGFGSAPRLVLRRS